MAVPKIEIQKEKLVKFCRLNHIPSMERLKETLAKFLLDSLPAKY